MPKHARYILWYFCASTHYFGNNIETVRYVSHCCFVQFTRVLKHNTVGNANSWFWHVNYNDFCSNTCAVTNRFSPGGGPLEFGPLWPQICPLAPLQESIYAGRSVTPSNNLSKTPCGRINAAHFFAWAFVVASGEKAWKIDALERIGGPCGKLGGVLDIPVCDIAEERPRVPSGIPLFMGTVQWHPCRTWKLWAVKHQSMS